MGVVFETQKKVEGSGHELGPLPKLVGCCEFGNFQDGFELSIDGLWNQRRLGRTKDTEIELLCRDCRDIHYSTHDFELHYEEYLF